MIGCNRCQLDKDEIEFAIDLTHECDRMDRCEFDRNCPNSAICFPLADRVPEIGEQLRDSTRAREAAMLARVAEDDETTVPPARP